MASFMFLPVLDYFSEISSPKATKSRAVGPFTTNDVFVYRNIHRKRSKKVKNGSQIPFVYVFCPFQTMSRRFRRRRRRNHGPYACSLRTAFFENIHKKSQKRSKIGHKWHVLCFCPFQIIFRRFRRRRQRNHGP